MALQLTIGSTVYDMSHKWKSPVGILKHTKCLMSEMSSEELNILSWYVACGRLSPNSFVFCVIYGYCMTLGEKPSHDIDDPPFYSKNAGGIMDSCKFPI